MRATSGSLLKQYVTSGDQASHPADASPQPDGRGPADLCDFREEASADPNGFLDQGSKLVVATGQIVALRQAGDVKGAADGLTKLSDQFKLLTAAQNDSWHLSSRERRLRRTAPTAPSTTARWLAVSAAALGLAIVFGTSVVVVRKLARRRVAGAATTG